MGSWSNALDHMTKTIRNTYPAVGVKLSVAYTYWDTSTTDTITAVFDEAHYVQDIAADGQPVDATAPVLTVRDADLVRSPQRRDTLIIDSQGYIVDAAHPDGSGMTACIVSRT